MLHLNFAQENIKINFYFKSNVTNKQQEEINWIMSKLKFSVANDTIKKVKRQPIEWKKIFTNHICVEN